MSHSAYNESYLEPDGRLGTHVPITLCANRANFNLDHQINIHGGAQGEREEGFCKNVTRGGCLIVKLNYPILHALDVDPVVQIEVCIVCTKKLICT